jgi:hypothetical protein
LGIAYRSSQATLEGLSPKLGRASKQKEYQAGKTCSGLHDDLLFYGPIEERPKTGHLLLPLQ